MNKIKVFDKIKLKNGDEFRLIEYYYPDEKVKNKENVEEKNNNTARKTIKIISVNKPVMSATFILTRDKEYIGHISTSIYGNNTASLLVSSLANIQLPIELSDYQETIKKHDAALFVSENHRRQGKATQLLRLMFKYLNENGINDLIVEGIVDDIALKTYLNTGAEVLSPGKAIYRNIRRFLKKEKSEDIER